METKRKVFIPSYSMRKAMQKKETKPVLTGASSSNNNYHIDDVIVMYFEEGVDYVVDNYPETIELLLIEFSKKPQDLVHLDNLLELTAGYNDIVTSTAVKYDNTRLIKYLYDNDLLDLNIAIKQASEFDTNDRLEFLHDLTKYDFN